MELSIEADKEFLRVRISGRDSPEPPSHVCAAVFRGRRLGRNRILIELDQNFPLSPAAQYELVTRLPGLGLTHQHSIALVHRTPVAQMANELISVVADNRNLGVRNFRDVEQAAAGLRARPA